MNPSHPTPRRWIAGMLGFLISAAALHGAPYDPEGMPVEWRQPDGRVLSLRVFGDEFYARTETLDGFTVVHDPADNAYHYARLSADGRRLIPGGGRVDGRPPAGTPKHLQASAEQRRAMWKERHQRLAPDERANWAKRVEAARQRKGLEAPQPAPGDSGGGAAPSSPAFAPVTGGYVGLTILVQFPDDPATGTVDPTNFPTTRTKMERYCNEIGYTDDGNTGSVRDYFRAQSLNQTDYTQLVTDIVTLPQPRNYYNYLDYPTNATLRDGGLTGRLVLSDAVTILKNQGFDFTGLSKNGSNQVIATNVIFAGPTSGVWPDGLWPHRWVMSPQINVGTGGTNTYIYDYQITNAASSAVPIGTFCHENGHLLLKYPDLYDYGGESEGVGNHCLMGAGNHLNGGKTPAPINGYFKDVSGWSNVVDITTSDFLTAALTTTNNMGYRIRKPGTATEYFLVENRGTGDPWAQYAPDKGILVWHVDETVNGNENQQMTLSQHYEVSLEQADGAFDLENGRDRGDSADLFDSSHTLGFSDTTNPDAKWWSGANSGIRIAFLSSPGASMNVRFGLPSNSVAVSSPNGGETIYLGSTQTITWAANITGNVKIELLKGGTLHSVLSANEANDGTYPWTVSTGLPVGGDYAIRITSIDNPAYTDTSDAVFSILQQPTLAEALDTTGINWTTTGNASWFPQSVTTHDGIDAAQSGDITHSQTSSLETTLTGPGTLTFWWKVSSETNYDFLRFYLNNVEQTGSVAKISGEVNWVQKTVSIPAGGQAVKWSFTKDGSVDTGADAAWVDQVVYTPTAGPEIAVEYPAGTNLTDGGATINAGSVLVGSSSAPLTVTVRNTGNANLTGLALSKSGANAADFTLGALGSTTVAPGGSTTFTVTFSPSASGARTAALQLASNDADENPFDINLTGTGAVPGTLVVTPAGGLAASGLAGGPFNPSSVQYTLQNTGGTSINWTAAKTQGWVTLSSTGGTLAAGASTNVTVSLNSGANTLPGGNHADTVTFTNTTNGGGNTTRPVALSITALTAVWSSNFDGTVSGWTTSTSSGSATWSLVTNTTASHTPDKFYSAPVPASKVTSHLVSPAIPIPAGSSLNQLRFWHHYNLEDLKDGGRIQLSLDGGSTWFEIDDTNSGASFAASGYNGSMRDTGKPADRSAYDGKTAWTGNSGGYVETVVDLNGSATRTYAGSSLRVRWTIATNSSTASSHWRVDSISMISDGGGASPGSLAVTTAGGLSATGLAGGPFTPASKVYTLENSGGSPINWTASNVETWLTLSSSGGTLAAGGTANVTVSINANADLLPVGGYADTLTFTNTTNGSGDTTRAVSLTVNTPGTLAVTPAGPFTTSGLTGGPFSPNQQQYTLQNTGAGPLDWTASAAEPWLSLSAPGGTLAAGATTVVTVSLNSEADTLEAGGYADTISFANTTNGLGDTTRDVSLTVNEPGSLSVNGKTGFTSAGSYGGPFAPTSIQYTLSNPGTTPVDWTASKAAAWLNLSATGGSLAAGAETVVTVSLNAAANALGAGSHGDTVVFTNTTNSTGTTTRDISLTVTPATATVTLGDLAQTFSGSPKNPSATTDPPGLAHSFSYVPLPGAPTDAGTYPVVVTITDPNYSGSDSGNLVIAKAPQTINFPAPPPVPDDAAPFVPAATASSGLAVSLDSSNPAVATVSGNTVTVVGLGSTTLTATQAGDSNHEPAAPVQQTLTVVRAQPLAAAGGPYAVVFGQALVLDGGASLPSGGESLTAHEWDLDHDDTFGDVTGATPAAIPYATLAGSWGLLPGANPIQLRVTDSAGKTSVASTTVTLIPALAWDSNAAVAGRTDGAGPWLGADQWWDGSSNTSWVSGTNATFGTGGAGGAVTLAAPITAHQLTFEPFTGTYTLGDSGNALTLGGGIVTNPGAGAVSIASPLVMGADQTWSVEGASLDVPGGADNGGHTLTVTGSGTTSTAISGAGGLVKNGAGTLVLDTSGYSGTTTVNGGKLLIDGTLADFNSTLVVNSGATLGGAGAIGRHVTIAGGGKLEFDLSSPAASHDPLDLSAGKDWNFAGASELTITTAGGASPGTYTLVTGGNNLAGNAPATVHLPVDWIANVTIAGNSLLLELLSTNGIGPVDHFAITGVPASTTLGTTLTGITLTALDAADQVATSFTGTVTFGGTAGVTGTSASFVDGVLSGVSVTPTAAGSALSFTVDDGAGHTGSASLDVVTIYQQWAAGFLPTDVTDPDAGSDGDALGNLLEFAFGTDPTVPDARPLADDGSAHGTPVARSTGGPGVAFDFLFIRRDDHGSPGSATYTAQFTHDLTTWFDSTATPSLVADSGVDADYEVVQVPYPSTLPDGKTARFARVKVDPVTP